MRIITGSARGCKLKAPKGLLTRPTADRVKESVFNMIGTEIFDARVLDLFAGTGNLGLEALSRGAISAVFVDQDADSVRAVQENAAHTKLSVGAEIIRSDVFAALEKFGRANRTFDFVFCDPPYGKGLAQRVLNSLDALGILSDGAVIVVEHAKADEFVQPLQHITMQRRRVYGSTAVSFFLKAHLDTEVAEDR